MFELIVTIRLSIKIKIKIIFLEKLIGTSVQINNIFEFFLIKNYYTHLFKIFNYFKNLNFNNLQIFRVYTVIKLTGNARRGEYNYMTCAQIPSLDF